jgi:hypothetical protein
MSDDNVESELPDVLVARQKEVGGFIVTSDHSVFHNPTGAFFKCDEAGTLTLVNPLVIARSDDIPLITEGAKEALRQEIDRDPRIRLIWQGRPI